MANAKKGGLGRGLGALIPQFKESSDERAHDTAAAHERVAEADRVLHLDPETIQPNPKQPRTVFSEEALQELAESIQRYGVQEPVIVRKVGGAYQLVSGERRVRASIMAGQATVPAICRDVADDELLKLGLIENIQREDLNAMEAARAYSRLIRDFQLTQEELAKEVGKQRATITNTLRLLQLPAEVQDRVEDGSISMGHARALLAFSSPQTQSTLCRRIIDEGLSVRQVEQFGAMQKGPAKSSAKTARPSDPNVTALEDELRRKFGTRVRLHGGNTGKGKIEIEYSSADERERLLELLRSLR